MRKRISTILMGTGFVGGAMAAVTYIYFMWTQDWGPMFTRGHNLMLVLTLFGTVFVFLAVLAVFGMIAAWIDPKMGT